MEEILARAIALILGCGIAYIPLRIIFSIIDRYISKRNKSHKIDSRFGLIKAIKQKKIGMGVTSLTIQYFSNYSTSDKENLFSNKYNGEYITAKEKIDLYNSEYYQRLIDIAEQDKGLDIFRGIVAKKIDKLTGDWERADYYYKVTQIIPKEVKDHKASILSFDDYFEYPAFYFQHSPLKKCIVHENEIDLITDKSEYPINLKFVTFPIFFLKIGNAPIGLKVYKLLNKLAHKLAKLTPCAVYLNDNEGRRIILYYKELSYKCISDIHSIVLESTDPLYIKLINQTIGTEDLNNYIASNDRYKKENIIYTYNEPKYKPEYTVEVSLICASLTDNCTINDIDKYYIGNHKLYRADLHKIIESMRNGELEDVILCLDYNTNELYLVKRKNNNESYYITGGGGGSGCSSAYNIIDSGISTSNTIYSNNYAHSYNTATRNTISAIYNNMYQSLESAKEIREDLKEIASYVQKYQK